MPNIESLLEIVTVADASRRVEYSENALFEAPNWSRDGSFLVFNKHGRLYRYNFSDHSVDEIDSDFADANNNDHGISPDGRSLVISHHNRDNDGLSQIYTLPIEGGRPTMVTTSGPSYWHGWSPDGSTLAFVAGRKAHPDYKIYRIAITGGEERQLTFGEGLDDGPDYSADGNTIFFNSHRSGRMQIWRMDSDGSNPRQCVFSEGSDWFPHPSPDGKKLVFLRYLEDQGQAHPFGRDVRLMIMDLQSEKVSALTEVFFGGQGTINVPSWSPDSRELAFVSYRQK